MSYSRRRALGLGTAALAGLGLTPLGPFAGRAQETVMQGDTYAVEGGDIVIRPVEHASFVMTMPGMVIYNDPVGGADRFAGLPRPDLILITHEHSDHFDPPTLAGLVGENTSLLTNPAVHAMLPDEMKARATAIANGEATIANSVSIAAIPAYNTTPDRMKYHPQGRDNGYILGIGGKQVYIAGDTEDIPEMRALTGIDIAFVPMNLPYTMSIEQASDAVAAFAPGVVYPYHYQTSDIDGFARLLGATGAATEVVRGAWYPA